MKSSCNLLSSIWAAIWAMVKSVSSSMSVMQPWKTTQHHSASQPDTVHEGECVHHITHNPLSTLPTLPTTSTSPGSHTPVPVPGKSRVRGSGSPGMTWVVSSSELRCLWSAAQWLEKEFPVYLEAAADSDLLLSAETDDTTSLISAEKPYNNSQDTWLHSKIENAR